MRGGSSKWQHVPVINGSVCYRVLVAPLYRSPHNSLHDNLSNNLLSMNPYSNNGLPFFLPSPIFHIFLTKNLRISNFPKMPSKESLTLTPMPSSYLPHQNKSSKFQTPPKRLPRRVPHFLSNGKFPCKIMKFIKLNN